MQEKNNNQDHRYLCYLCYFFFSNMSGFKEDKLSKRGIRNGLYRCKHCKYKTTKKELLKQHNLSQHLIRSWYRFKCKHCDYKSDRKKDFENHLLSVHLGINTCKWCRCAHCNYKSRTKEELIQHIFSRHHFTNETPLRNQTCEISSTNNNTSAMTCLEEVFDNKEKPEANATIIVISDDDSSCVELLDSSNSEDSQDSVEYSKTKWFECTKCECKFMLEYHLKEHISAKHRSKR